MERFLSFGQTDLEETLPRYLALWEFVACACGTRIGRVVLSGPNGKYLAPTSWESNLGAAKRFRAVPCGSAKWAVYGTTPMCSFEAFPRSQIASNFVEADSYFPDAFPCNVDTGGKKKGTPTSHFGQGT